MKLEDKSGRDAGRIRSTSTNYKVGKGRAPEARRWRPGVSGNPRGRPKGSKNRKTIIGAAERRTFTVTKNGRRRKMTALEIGLHNLQQEILRGNTKAFLAYLAILQQHGDSTAGASTFSDLLAEDEAILKDFLERKANS
jgi:hypothetical protein